MRATEAGGIDPVYVPRFGWRRIAAAAGVVAALALCATSAIAAPRVDTSQGPAGTLLDARDALRKKDRARLAALRAQAAAEHNPLAMWVDYWELANRLGDAHRPS